MPGGGKLWRLDYRLHGKRKLHAIGSYPEITLQGAREKAKKAREGVEEGIDPVLAKRAEAAAAKLAGERTFSAIAALLIEKKRAEGKAEITLSKMKWIIDKVQRDLGPIDAAMHGPSA